MAREKWLSKGIRSDHCLSADNQKVGLGNGVSVALIQMNNQLNLEIC